MDDAVPTALLQLVQVPRTTNLTDAIHNVAADRVRVAWVDDVVAVGHAAIISHTPVSCKCV
jgi:hypothetical protein